MKDYIVELHIKGECEDDVRELLNDYSGEETELEIESVKRFKKKVKCEVNIIDMSDGEILVDRDFEFNDRDRYNEFKAELSDDLTWIPEFETTKGEIILGSQIIKRLD